MFHDRYELLSSTKPRLSSFNNKQLKSLSSWPLSLFSRLSCISLFCRSLLSLHHSLFVQRFIWLSSSSCVLRRIWLLILAFHHCFLCLSAVCAVRLRFRLDVSFALQISQNWPSFAVSQTLYYFSLSTLAQGVVAMQNFSFAPIGRISITRPSHHCRSLLLQSLGRPTGSLCSLVTCFPSAAMALTTTLCNFVITLGHLKIRFS